MKIKELKNLKQIKLSESEKKDLLKRICNKAGILSESTYAPKLSPFYRFSFLFDIKYMKISVLACLVLLFTSATAFASLNSLPGDMLYPIKTKVIEKVADLSAWSPEQRAVRNSEKIEERIKEFETLADKGRLSDEETKNIDRNIKNNFDDFDRNVKEIKEENNDEDKNTEVRNKLETDLESNLSKHAEKIEKIRDDNKAKNKHTLDSVFERVSTNRENEDRRIMNSLDIDN